MNFAAEPEPFEDFIKPYQEQFGFLKQENCRMAVKLPVELDCNWKFAVENLLDIYHVKVLHATTFGAKFNADRKNIKLDPHFKEFHDWCRQNNVPVVVLSSGMEPIIRALLVHLVGKEADDIQIVANNVAPREGKSINEQGGWQIVFHDDR